MDGYTGAFIFEDLIPLRSKLLHCIKSSYEHFVLAHTINVKVPVKKSITCTGKNLLAGEKHEGMSNWITINSLEDLVEQGEELN